MHFNRSLLRLAGCGMLAVALLIAAYGQADACNVPVFRYALERWQSAPYRVTLLHEGPLSSAHKALAAELIAAQEKEGSAIELSTIDVAASEDGSETLRSALGDQPLPALVAQYPRDVGVETPFWTGPCDARSVAALLDSPLRQELIGRLSAGETAVWLVLESGDADKDDAAVRLLEQQLKRLQAELKLPELTDEPEDALLPGLPLQISFSTVRVPRGAEETALVAMLLHCEPDLKERTDPLVYPVFGRGRALFPLVGAGITAENIENSSRFLVGACSCEVKEQNPGFDLLLAAEWNALLGSHGLDIAAVSEREALQAGPPEIVPIPAGAKVSTTDTSASATPEQLAATANPGQLWVLIGGGSLMGLLAVAFVCSRWFARG